MKEHMGVVIAGGSGAKLTCRGCLDLANLINSGPPLPTSLVELPDLINLLAAGPPPSRRQTWPKRDTFENSEKKTSLALLAGTSLVDLPTSLSGAPGPH